MDQITAIAILTIFPLCMLFATFNDLFEMRIPNYVSLALLGGFFVLAPLAGMSLETMAWSVGVGLLAFAISFVLFSLGLMGGGDAKLVSVSVIWFGTAFAMQYVLIASIIGGVLTLLFIGLRNIPLPQSLLKLSWVERLYQKSVGIPYGAALGPAALFVFLGTPWMQFIIAGTPIG